MPAVSFRNPGYQSIPGEDDVTIHSKQGLLSSTSNHHSYGATNGSADHRPASPVATNLPSDVSVKVRTENCLRLGPSVTL